MNKRYTYHIIIFFSVAVICNVAFPKGFAQEKKITTKEELINKEVEKKIRMFKAKRLKECRKNAVNDAEAYVDSLIAHSLSLEFVDTIPFPPKPERPEKVRRNSQTIDTSEVKRIFEEKEDG